MLDFKVAIDLLVMLSDEEDGEEVELKALETIVLALVILVAESMSTPWLSQFQ